MRITRIKLSGFKSFVDPAELRVLPGLTGVVGPNGCGKSNLLEAIRWAMGEGSAKSLRGGAMEDVIFAGTAGRPQRQFAEVSILAERPGDDGDDEVEVTRRIERGAGSAYRINGRDVRARDAQVLFADAATGAHSPALVSQGRIGAVIAAKPAERRAMLEEAAGISGLHVRRREAELRLKATETNLERVAQAAAELEARAGALRRQARAAERYRRLTENIRLAEARLIFARWRDADAAARAARAEAAEAEASVADLAEKQRAAAAWVREAGDRLADLRKGAQLARDTAAEARHGLQSAESERLQIEARLIELARTREQLEADRAREGELANDAAGALTRLRDEQAALETRIAADAAARRALAAAAGEADRAVAEAELARAQAAAAQARADAERRVAEAAWQQARTFAVRAAADHARLVEEAARLRPLAEAEGEHILAQGRRTQLEGEVAAAVRAIAQAEAEAAAATEAAEAAQALLAETRTLLRTAESEAGALAANPAEAGQALAAVVARPGFEAALAAALADDLHAGLGADGGARRWIVVGGAEPPIAVGTPLAELVEAPRELLRRLAQVAVVEVDDGQPLGLGQRLVTRDGRMRRWDGFISEQGGGAAAETLKRSNRLRALQAQLPELRRSVGEDEQRSERAQAARQAALDGLAHARRLRETRDALLREALRAEDHAAGETERLAVRHADLRGRLVQAERDLDAAQDAAGSAWRVLDGLPPAAQADLLAPFDARVQEARDAARDIGHRLAALDHALAGARQRLIDAEREAEGWRQRSGKAGKRVADMTARARALEDEAAALEADPRRSTQRAVALQAELQTTAAAAEDAVKLEQAGEAALREREAVAESMREALAEAREARAGASARADNEENRRIEMGRVSSERFECPAPLLPGRVGFNGDAVEPAQNESRALEQATQERERLGPVNLVAESELARVEAERDANSTDVEDLTEAVARLRGSIGQLNREGRQRLRAAFEAVNAHFRTLFTTLFNGGEAHLALIDSDDPLDAGLEIMAQPPGKKLASLTLLSGGEQALTAVALIFALFLTNPSPLCVLDEVDAPLDDANVERFCDLLDRMARDTDTRYLVVTHNAVTMSRMDRLYGVTMIEQGVSRLVSVDLGRAEALLGLERAQSATA